MLSLTTYFARPMSERVETGIADLHRTQAREAEGPPAQWVRTPKTSSPPTGANPHPHCFPNSWPCEEV